MTDLQHIRGAIVDPRTGVPTSLFYDFLTNLTASTEVAVEDSEFALFNLFGDSTGDSSRNEVEALVNSLYLIPDSTASIEKLHRLVDDVKTMLYALSGSSAELAALQTSFDKQQYTAMTKTEDYTAKAFDFINAKSGCKITFPAAPKVNDVIIIRNGDRTTIRLDGNGKLLNEEKTRKQRQHGKVRVYQYFSEDDGWFAR